MYWKQWPQFSFRKLWILILNSSVVSTYCRASVKVFHSTWWRMLTGVFIRSTRSLFFCHKMTSLNWTLTLIPSLISWCCELNSAQNAARYFSFKCSSESCQYPCGPNKHEPVSKCLDHCQEILKAVGVCISLRWSMFILQLLLNAILLFLQHSLSPSLPSSTQPLHHGCQHPWSDCHGVFLPAGAADWNMGFLQVQKETEEKFSGCSGDGAAGEPRDKLGGGHFHHDRWGAPTPSTLTSTQIFQLGSL